MGAFLPFSYLNVCGFWNYFFFCLLAATVVAAIVVAIFVVAAHFGLTFKV